MDKEQKLKRAFLMDWDNRRSAVVKVAQELQNRGYEIVYWVVPYKDEIANNKLQFTKTQFHWHDGAINFMPPAEINEADFAPPGADFI